ncbi:sugar transferase [Agromyces sp. Marseille-P2726]|uniref:sugar transferase n=1 Tax=Agromyces sp. Marseille-P2726 TaxID=2709132 RepID=UPI00156DFFEC|nr:sugar transferase [Agromyces sp. Marseille-P2726]
MTSARMTDAAPFAPSATAVESGRAIRRRVTVARGNAAFWVRPIRWRLAATDTAVVFASIATATAGGPATEPAVLSASRSQYAAIAGLTAITWLACIASSHTRDDRVLGMGALEYRRIATATVFEFGILALIVLVAGLHLTRTFVLIALPVGLFGLLLERWLWRKWLLAQRRMGKYLARAIVVGEASDAEYVVHRIGERRGVGYRVIGVATNSPSHPFFDEGGTSVPVVAAIPDVGDRARELGAEAVIIAGRTPGDSEFIRELSWQLEGSGAELVLSSPLTDVAGPRIHFHPVEGLPLIQVEIPQFEGGKHALKRGFDLVAASLGLLVIAPVLLAIAVAIRLDGPGPILYAQDRVGRDGRTFRMLKFRTMVPDADQRLRALAALNEGSGPLFKLHDDPRVTSVGRFLRRHSLDELPQLFNVLRGDMSMVGPRPPLTCEVEEYEGHVHRRLLIKPGLTGLWQVSGRSDLEWDEGVRLDLYYVENWSLTGDLMLIWRTLRVVLRGDGAY